MCEQKFPGLFCRPIAAQFMTDDTIALFEMVEDEEGRVKVLTEKHYKLVPPEDLSAEELKRYSIGTD